jgi:DNA polymerase III sliding clamp (beta) subunit (PCNA family)
LRFNVDSEALAPFLRLADRVLRKDADPIEIEASADPQEVRLLLHTQDLDAKAVITEVVVSKAGRGLVYGRPLKRLLAGVAGAVTFDASKPGKLAILASSTKAAFSLPILDSQWPAYRGLEGWAKLDGSLLVDGLSRAILACGESFYDWRDGVSLEAKAGVLRLFASDGHRMSEQRLPSPGLEIPQVCVPRAIAKEIAALDFIDEVSTATRAIGVRGAGLELVAPLLAVAAPGLSFELLEGDNYRAEPLELSTLRLKEALSRIGSVAGRDKAHSRISLALEGKELSLSFSDPQLGEALAKVDVDYSGSSFGYCLNRFYLEDALSQLKSDATAIKLPRELTHPLILENPNACLKVAVLGMAQPA